MLSLPHLVVLFVIALVVFGPQKLPELARMLGKATAEFRKLTNDFRYGLENEVRELERQTLIRNEEIAAAKGVQPPATPEGAQPRESSGEKAPPADPGAAQAASPENDVPQDVPRWDGQITITEKPPHADVPPAQPEAVSAPQEKPSDDNTAV